MANYLIPESEMTILENKIKEVAGISGKLEYPQGFVEAINNLNIPRGISLYDLIGNESWSGVIENNTLSYLASYAFYYNQLLTLVEFDECITIGDSAFYSCLNLSSIHFPKCEIIDKFAFENCSNLSTINFPLATRIDNRAFYCCENLSVANLSKCNYLGTYTFGRCSNLISLYLMNSSVAQINTFTFSYTPITDSSYLGYFGSIFIPFSLLSEYQNHSMWSRYSARLVGVE